MWPPGLSSRWSRGYGGRLDGAAQAGSGNCPKIRSRGEGRDMWASIWTARACLVLCVDEKTQIQAPVPAGVSDAAGTPARASTTTFVTARACMPPWTWPPERLSAPCMPTPPRSSWLENDPPTSARGPGLPRRSRQRLYAQDSRGEALAAHTPVRPALHPDQLKLAQPRGARSRADNQETRRGTHTSVRQLNADIRAWRHLERQPAPHV